MKVIHKKTSHVLGSNIKTAKGVQRLVGLMFVNEIQGMDGLLIRDCRSIHNCFVRFPIDAVFVNKKFEIVKLLKNFKPWRFSGIYLKASHVIELPKGTISDDMKVGDELEVSHV